MKKSVAIAILLIVVILVGVYVYDRYFRASISGRATVSGNGGSSVATTVTTTVIVVPSSNSNAVISYDAARSVFNTTVNAFSRFINWVIGFIKSESIRDSIIRGTIISVVFFIAGYIINIVARIIRIILYALGVVSALFTVLIVLGVV